MRNPLVLLKNREFIFLLALGSGLALGQGASYTRETVVPALAVIMTLSCLAVPSSTFRQPRHLLGPALLGALMNYGLLSSVILLLGWWLVPEPNLFRGLVVVAAVPPAIIVLPLAVVLDGDPASSLVGTMGAYLAGLALIPLMFLAFFGDGPLFDPRLLAAVLELVAGPILISRLLLRLGWTDWLERWRGTITNWGFFLVVYTVVGLNRNLFLNDPLALLPILAVLAASTFGIYELLRLILRWQGLSPSRVRSLLLLGTLKNYGLAAGLSLALFDPATAAPATAATLVFIPYLIWLSLRYRWERGQTG